MDMRSFGLRRIFPVQASTSADGRRIIRQRIAGSVTLPTNAPLLRFAIAALLLVLVGSVTLPAMGGMPAMPGGGSVVSAKLSVAASRAATLSVPPPGGAGKQGTTSNGAHVDDLPSCGVGLGPISVDPCKWAMQAFLAWLGWSIGTVTSGLTTTILSINQSDIFLGTPHALADDNAAVRQMATLMQMLALSALTILVAIGGFVLMLRPHVGLSSYEIAQFLPRVLVGGIGIVVVGWFCGQLIDLANLLSTAGATSVLLPVNAPSLSTLGDGSDPPLALLLVAFVVLGYTLLALLVAIQLLIRLATLDVLLAVAPLAVACWILPQTQRWAERWAAFLVGTLLIQPLQLITVSLGLGIATAVPQAPALSRLFGSLNVELIEGLLCVAAYYVAFKVPRLLSQIAMGSSTLGVLSVAALVGGSLLRTGITLTGLAAGGAGGVAAGAAGVAASGVGRGGAASAGGAGGGSATAGAAPMMAPIMAWPATLAQPSSEPAAGGMAAMTPAKYAELQTRGVGDAAPLSTSASASTSAPTTEGITPIMPWSSRSGPAHTAASSLTSIPTAAASSARDSTGASSDATAETAPASTASRPVFGDASASSRTNSSLYNEGLSL